MDLKVGVAVLVIVGMVELEEAVAVMEALYCKGPLILLLGDVIKMGLNVGEAVDIAGAAGEEGSEVTLFDCQTAHLAWR